MSIAFDCVVHTVTAEDLRRALVRHPQYGPRLCKVDVGSIERDLGPLRVLHISTHGDVPQSWDESERLSFMALLQGADAAAALYATSVQQVREVRSSPQARPGIHMKRPRE